MQALEQISLVDHGGPMLEQTSISERLQPVERTRTRAEERSVRRKERQRGFCPDHGLPSPMGGANKWLGECWALGQG